MGGSSMHLALCLFFIKQCVSLANHGRGPDSSTPWYLAPSCACLPGLRPRAARRRLTCAALHVRHSQPATLSRIPDSLSCKSKVRPEGNKQ